MNNIKRRLADIKKSKLYRNLNYLSSPQEKNVIIDDENLLLMASNNYLALANREEIKREAIRAINKYGFGSGGSRLTTGTYELNKKLEEKIAMFFNREKALVFNSGYSANVGTISSICDHSYTIFSDELNHASIIDGCKLSKAKTVVFKHNDIVDLSRKIKMKETKNALIITEGVFSMDGDICNLPLYVNIAREFNSLLMVDDAHGFGVIGKCGKGILEYYHMNEEVDIYLGTLSKAVGSEGGFIAGKDEIIDFIKNKARPFIFSTSIPMASIAASLKAFEIIEKEKNVVEKLQWNIKYLNKKLEEINIKSKSNSAIIPILIGSEEKAIKASQYLRENGIFVPAIRYPTVKMGEAILRICLMTTHNKEDIDLLCEILRKALE